LSIRAAFEETHIPSFAQSFQGCPYGCQKCTWYSSTLCRPSSQDTLDCADAHPSGKCPRNCICHEKYYGLVCDQLVGIVSKYSDQIRHCNFPPMARPSRDCLVGIAMRDFWLEKGDNLPVRDPSSDLLLYWPLSHCFHSMYKNIKIILSDFAELELEVYGRLFGSAEEGTLDADCHSGALPPTHKFLCLGSNPSRRLHVQIMNAAPTSEGEPLLCPRKKLRQSTLAQVFRI
jgi:hypothetical protein